MQFADGIDAIAEEEQELEKVVESLDKTCTRYKMEISAEKTKLMTNSAEGIQKKIKVKEHYNISANLVRTFEQLYDKEVQSR